MSHSEFWLGGVLPAMLTPFGPDGSLNLEGIRLFVGFLVERGVHGLYPCGTNGQAQNLGVEVRKKVAETVVGAAPSGVKVVVHVGTNSHEDTLALAKHAEDIGAHAVAAITPYYYPYDDEALVDYYVSVARSVDLPFFLYNYPQRTGNTLSVGAIKRIVGAAPNVVGIKDSGGDLGYLQDAVGVSPGFLVFNGADNLFLPALSVGACGQVSGLANAYPELFVGLYQAWVSGDLERARRLQALISRLRRLLSAPYLEPLFEALRIRGLDIGHVKRPLRRLSEAEAASLRAAIEGLGLEQHLRPL